MSWSTRKRGGVRETHKIKWGRGVIATRKERSALCAALSPGSLAIIHFFFSERNSHILAGPANPVKTRYRPEIHGQRVSSAPMIVGTHFYSFRFECTTQPKKKSKTYPAMDNLCTIESVQDRQLKGAQARTKQLLRKSGGRRGTS